MLPARLRFPRRHTVALSLITLSIIVITTIITPKTFPQVSDLVESNQERIRGLGRNRVGDKYWEEWAGDPPQADAKDEKGGKGEKGWVEQVKQVEASHEDDGPQLVLHTNANGCGRWNPDGKEEDDPKNCLQARQYRQVEKVLEREDRGDHGHWYFTRNHNMQVLRTLLRCFLPKTHPNSKSCPPKPLILSGWWYTAESLNKGASGETIWQAGLVKEAEAMGIMFIAVGPYDNWIEVAEMMPDVYRVIWNSDIETISCITDPRCIAKEHYVPPVDGEDRSIGVPDNERGVIPLWALNIVDYWGCQPKEMSHVDYWWSHTEPGDWSYHPLGQDWIATPWPMPGHNHLPYSIEERCKTLPMTPHDERNETVLIFTKRSSYFDNNQVSPRDYWSTLAKDPSFDIILTAKEEEGHPLPDGLTTIGKQTIENYDKLVGSVKVMLGMGLPRISPSVYTALCQGTPVVVPYLIPNVRTDGWHLYSGLQQHGPAAQIGEPYVYTYYSNNYSQLVEVVHRALRTPIERYIPPNMKYDYAIKKLRVYLNRDLQKMFRQVLVANGGKVPGVPKGAMERCRELGRCIGYFPAGRTPKLS